MKIDLHVHSCHSIRSSIWLLKKIGCAECYTTPRQLYDIARKQGMDAVTITDHNSIDGALEIADLPDVFVSCEVTAYFPEDQCKLHVLVYDITEDQFREIDRLRTNVYEMADYLNKNNIYHGLAHPFFSLNDKLDLDKFEKCLLLFNHFEINGDEEYRCNDILQLILNNLEKNDLDQLASRHNINPVGDIYWQKGLFGGSDDHSSLNIARTYTEVPDACTLSQFWNGYNNRRSKANIAYKPSPRAMAQNIYGVAYQFYDSKLHISQYRDQSIIVRFLDNMLQSRDRKSPRLLNRLYMQWKIKTPTRQPASPNSGVDLLRQESHKLIAGAPEFSRALKKDNITPDEADGLWFNFVNQVSNTLLTELAKTALHRIRNVNLFALFETIGSAGALYMLMAPYFISYSVYAKNRRLSEKIAAKFCGWDKQNLPNVALFTDTLNDVNGVAITLKNQAKMAYEMGKQFTVISCSDNPETALDGYNIQYFRPISSMETPEYPGQVNHIPPLLKMVDYCYENNFTHIHAATPGMVGLAALATARIMHLPFYTTYHTAFPQYVSHLTDDSSIEELAWKYILWFYNQSDIIYVSSKATWQELTDRGISPAKIRMLPRGVDTRKFRPIPNSKPLDGNASVRFIYVGRVSKEKNLPWLAETFHRLYEKYSNISLTVVGDGPYLNEMKSELKGTSAIFTGYLDSEELAGVYSACDVFVFPSNTDTFGNVVLEAQACGLPVIVTDMGGPCENMIDNETGFIISGNERQQLYNVMEKTIKQTGLLDSMRDNVIKYASKRSLERSFEQYWQQYSSDHNNRMGADKSFEELFAGMPVSSIL